MRPMAERPTDGGLEKRAEELERAITLRRQWVWQK